VEQRQKGESITINDEHCYDDDDNTDDDNNDNLWVAVVFYKLL